MSTQRETQDFERWIREKLHSYLLRRLDESKIVEADPPKDQVSGISDLNNCSRSAQVEQ